MQSRDIGVTAAVTQKRGLDKEYVNVTVALFYDQDGTAKAVTDGFFKLTGKQPAVLRILHPK
jgi:hypothetical protein